MEGVKRTNTVVVKNFLQGQGGKRERMRRNSYAIEMDKRRNCYNCERFGYLAWNCKNQRIVGQRRRIKYEDNLNSINNLKEEESLVVLN